jgi:thioesterase domain-containing protein
VLAFEIARQLTARGGVVGRLVLLDSLYPARRPDSRVGLWARGSKPARRLWLRCLATGHRLAALKARLEGRGATDGRRHLYLAGDLIPPRHSEKYMLELARYRIRPWDGVIDYVISESLRERHAEQPWEPFVTAVRVHRAEGDHVSYLRTRLQDNRELLRSLLE